MLGIKLEIDQSSVDKASKKLSDDKTQTKQDTSKKGASKPAIIGGAIGGILGTLISNLKPVKEFLGVISGFLTIALAPVIQLLKPYLILFMKVGFGLLKLFGPEGASKQKEALASGRGLDTSEVASEDIGLTGIVQGLKDKFFGWIETLFSEWLPVDEIGGFFKGSFMVLITGIANILFGVIDTVAGVFDFFVGLFTGNWDLMYQGLIKIITGLSDIFIGVVKTIAGAVLSFVSGIVYIFDLLIRLIWDGLKMLGNFGQWVFDSLVSILSKSLSVLGGIGRWIWDKITSFFGGGGSSKSHEDVLITSSGEVHDFSPQDNFIAFKDFNTLGNISGGGQNISITVNGFVGDEDTLADKIGRALSNRNRGGMSNY